MSSRGRLLLIDGHGLAYRAFYALPPLSTKKGQEVQAVYGFTNMLLKVFEEMKPDYVAVSFDKAPPTERLKEFSEYKAHRQKMPESLQNQMALIEDMVQALDIPMVWIAGQEADDCLGTLAVKAVSDGCEVVIVSADKDFFQLVSPGIRILAPRKGISDFVLYDAEEVKKKVSLNPSQIIDMKAMAGDPSDNIPGVAGIGEVTTKKLLVQFGSLENIFTHLDEVPPRWRNLLEASRESALMSKSLATIRTDLDLSFKPEEFRLKEPEGEKLKALLEELEFDSLLKKLFNEDAQTIMVNDHVFRSFTHLSTLKEWEEARRELQKHDSTAFFWILEGSGAGSASVNPSMLRVLACAASEDRLLYVTVFPPMNTTPSLFDLESATIPYADDVLKVLSPLFSKDRTVWGHDLKEWCRLLAALSINCEASLFDTAGAAHLLDPREASPRFSLVAQRHLSRTVAGREELFKRGKGSSIPEREELQSAGVEGVTAVIELVPILSEMLKREGLYEVFKSIELPLLPVLASMERKGIYLDQAVLRDASRLITGRLMELESSIYSLAGEHFNINSPKQLGEVLFGKLGIPAKEKTSQGFSTSQEVLQELVGSYAIVKEVLEYKELKKLQSTYVDTLPGMISSSTGRIHTTFNPRGTATGRLSSSEPNLQNIPVRTSMGSLIRRAFRPRKDGYCFIGADYSQIELRILAHLSDDEHLLDAFSRDEDIHTLTASEIFDVEPEKVNTSMRRKAKEINFGIIYGMSAHGLAQRTGVSRKEAQIYIDRYLTHFSGVKRFIDITISQAAKEGFVSTLMGRKRWLPDLSSRNVTIRKAAERVAINTPVQGSAADIIKKAMIDIDSVFRKRNEPSCLILQVHDELIFEAPDDRSEKVVRDVRSLMEGVYPSIKVPLRVKVKQGKNWADMEKEQVIEADNEEVTGIPLFQ